MTSMTYGDSGVGLGTIDSFGRQAQTIARQTAHHLEKHGYRELEWTRGESCYLYETPDCYRGHVNEGLGTKNRAADKVDILLRIIDAMQNGTDGKSYYFNMGIDTAAMIFNDMITVGCMPLEGALHVEAGSNVWFQLEQRSNDLLQGFKHAFDLAWCSWGGGETAVLPGMGIAEDTIILSGSAGGQVKPKSHLIKPTIQHGDAIILIESSGIHANGLSLARKIVDEGKLPNGYLTELSDGTTFGEELLKPTHIYVPFVRNCLNEQVEIHYVVNITGHGWRKLMRAVEPFVYIIQDPGQPHLIFRCMQQYGPIDDWNAYADLNMGAGFALIVPNSEVEKVIQIAKQVNLRAWEGGFVLKRGQEKKVIIEPLGLTYEADTLQVR